MLELSLICDTVTSRYFENLYHNRSELENIKTDWYHGCAVMHIQDSQGRAFLFANISKSGDIQQ